jgi:hypothetical protein
VQLLGDAMLAACGSGVYPFLKDLMHDMVRHEEEGA